MYLDNVRAFDHAKDIVQRAHADGLKVVLAFSAKRDELDHYVEMLDIVRYLTATTSIDDVDASKPAPVILAGLGEERVAADAAVVVRRYGL